MAAAEASAAPPRGSRDRAFLFGLLGFAMCMTVATMHMLDISPVMQTPHQVGSVLRSETAKSAAKSRGLLICLFDAMLPMTISLVQELRGLGFHDVIQLYHCNGELSSVSQEMLLEADKNVEIVDGCQEMIAAGLLHPNDANGYRSFWLKPLALVHTRLDEVILMDADDLVFQNPAKLFDVPGYKETGTIFFYDREILKNEYLNNYYGDKLNIHALVDTFDYSKFDLVRDPSSHLLSTLAWQGDAAHEQDSSIVVVKKSQAPLAIDVLWQILQHDRHRVGFTYGDKELFWLAYELSHRPYFFSPWANSGAERPGNMKDHPNTLCGGLAQFMPLETESSELLHINGGYIFNPYVNNDIQSMTDADARLQQLLQDVPSHVSARRHRSKPINRADDASDPRGFWPQECLLDRGSEPMRPQEVEAIKRRIHNAVAVAKLQQQRLKAQTPS